MNQPSGFRRVVRDVADLCELQIELLAVDGKVATRRSGIAIALLLISAIFALAAITAAVIALAALLHENAHWTISSSLLAAAGIAAAAGILFTIIGLIVLRKALSALDETRSEFAENLRWIKAVVVAPETSPRAQVREDSFNGRYTSAGSDYVR